MFKNYFKTAIRNLLRYKGFSVINITSLTIGVLGCLVIALFVTDEWKYDKSVKDHNLIYRMYNERTDENAITKAACVPPVFATFLSTTYPEIDTTTRILMSPDKNLLESDKNKNYEEKGIFTDPSFLNLFSLELVKGDSKTALNQPFSVVINQELANRYFSDNDPIGKKITIDKDPFTVTGVLAELPDHFHLDFRYLISLSSAGLPKDRMDKWTWNQFYTYVKVKPGSDVKQLETKFQGYVIEKIHPTSTDGSTFLPFFQPLKDVHLESSDFIYDNAIRGNSTYVSGLTIIALFVLIIAGFNFVNLATARSFRRAKEIGIRKVIGAERTQLILQFIGESVLLSLIAVVIAMIATFFIVPMLNQFTGKSIYYNPFTQPVLTIILLLAAVILGIIAGLYPAFILSAFKPIKVLKGIRLNSSANRSAWLRETLVVIQFALSALLIIASTIVYNQINFLNTKDVGFNKEQLLTFQIRGDVEKNIEVFKNELRKSPDIKGVTSGYGLPNDMFAGDQVIVPQNGVDKTYPVNYFMGDHDFIKTLGIKIIAGRDFSRELPTDVEEAFIINETAVKEYGFGTPQEALGKPMKWPKWEPDSLNPVKKGKVIGVISDFHYKSLHEKVTPSVLQMYPPVQYKVAVRLNTADIKNTIAYINNVWNRFSPGYPMDYSFMDEGFSQMYKSEQKLGSLLWIFTMMAILVGCLGLFALAAYSAEQRTKEISIRKVLGASTSGIVALLSKTFLKPVFIACIIAFPLAWWAMNKWLQNFPYRVSIQWWVFGLAAFAAVIIALITISFQSIKAATANPVNSLRSE
jgi:putative ABC transport system permease protein